MVFFWKKRKQLKDWQTVRKYGERLRAERKIYTQTATTYSETDRKSRCLAVGECCIRALEAIGELNLQHRLVPGTLEYMINQQRVKDDTGKKGFRYDVTYQVKSEEPKYTEDEIRDELKDVAKRLKLETEEMFKEDEEEEEGEG